MILLCGIPSEPPLARTVRAARRARIPHVVLNQRDTAFNDIVVDLSGPAVSGELVLRDRSWRLEEFHGVYTRMMDPTALPGCRVQDRRSSSPELLTRALAFHQALGTWLEVTSARVLNRNGPSASNMSKPFQAQAVVRSGLLTPPTLITNDPAEVLAFQREHTRVVYKSISSVRSIVRELHSGEQARLERLRLLVTQFQAYIPGMNIRVHVVGNRLFATAVHAEAVDYRYAHRDGETVRMLPFALPRKVREQCFALSRTLELPLCGIDLKRTPDGRYYCFEVNPSPAYSYYEAHTRQPIAAAIVRHLTGPESGRGRAERE